MPLSEDRKGLLKTKSTISAGFIQCSCSKLENIDIISKAYGAVSSGCLQ